MLNLIMLGADPFCGHSANIWKFVGNIMLVFKIVIPLLLIILGMVDLGKAVVGSKEDDIKKATTALMKRAIAGVVIFFIPTLIAVIFRIVPGANAEDWKICGDCISSPNNTEKCIQDDVLGGSSD